MVCKKMIAAIVAAVLSISIAGCGNATENHVEEPAKEDDRIQIGLSIDSLLIERWSRERDLFVSKA